MNQNISLLSVIIIIILFIYFIKYENNYNIKSKSITVKQDPCYLYENTNRTQTLYLKLINSLKKISATSDNKCNIKTLGNNCKRELYIQGTTDNRLKTELNEITKIILNKINSITGFYFKIVYFDTITVFEDCQQNKNFIYNVFIYDTNEELAIRLYINVIKYIYKCPKKNKLITCAETTTPGMKFEIGYPKPEQLIPLPTSVITTGGGPNILNNNGINIKEISPIKYLFVNEVKIYNTNSVINANGKCIKPSLCGTLMDTTLDSSIFNQPTTPFTEPSCVRNKWPKLYDEPENVKAWPCGTESPYWNKSGIPISSSCNTQIAGIRSSTTQFPVTPAYWPTLATLPRNSGPNYWMFNLTRGDPATDGADFTQ